MPRAVQIDATGLPDDVPMKLRTLARACFPDGSVSVAGLRLEARAGRLDIYKVAGVEMSTKAAIRQMVERCRVQSPPPASGSVQARATEPPSGASSTGEAARAQAALLAKLQRRRPALRPTSPRSASPRGSRNVVPIRPS